MAPVEFFYSIGSRYSYLASTQLAALAAETGRRFEWCPLSGVELRARRGRDPFEGPPLSGQYEWSYREKDAQRWADLYAVPFLEPRGRVEFDSQLLARACTAAKRLGRVVPYSHALYAAMFREPVCTIDEEECLRRAVAVGLGGEEFRREIGADETADDLDATIDRALTLGVFGVPSFVVDGELFWGNDRLVVLRHHLRRS